MAIGVPAEGRDPIAGPHSHARERVCQPCHTLAELGVRVAMEAVVCSGDDFLPGEEPDCAGEDVLDGEWILLHQTLHTLALQTRSRATNDGTLLRCHNATMPRCHMCARIMHYPGWCAHPRRLPCCRPPR